MPRRKSVHVLPAYGLNNSAWSFEIASPIDVEDAYEERVPIDAYTKMALARLIVKSHPARKWSTLYNYTKVELAHLMLGPGGVGRGRGRGRGRG